MSEEGAAAPPEARPRARKAPTAFRTISEVADDLQIPQHVLRFWETKFPQLKPLKRGGGRRYYRPEDIALLKRISDLLYTQGYTIKGVQRLLRDGGLEEGVVLPEPADLPEDPDAAAAAALREALHVLEGLAQELRLLTARN
jgi:DNA-binding transcriptional MerR regulator